MRIEVTLVPSLQIRPWKYSAGKYVWDHFWQSEHENQRKGRGGTVNNMSDYVEAVIWRCYTEVYLECSRTSMMDLLCSFEQRVQKVFLEISAKSMKAIC